MQKLHMNIDILYASIIRIDEMIDVIDLYIDV